MNKIDTFFILLGVFLLGVGAFGIWEGLDNKVVNALGTGMLLPAFCRNYLKHSQKEIE